MPETSIDVFAKARDNDRVALLRAAREADIVPYFRTVEGPARPVVEMEGAPRIMLGSNNYLGLTGDERVIQGARDALARYGTASSSRTSPTGRAPRTRSSSRPATRPTSARWARSSARATP
jgi:7-keto-8-aminopelargonate synthetase-like enzyme